MISIVVPVYEEGAAIVDWLRVLFDKHAVAQCIVVDASEPKAYKANWARVRDVFPGAELSYVSAREKGRGAQMNQGAEACTGNILLFLHADTMLPDGALAEIQDAIRDQNHWGRFDVSFDNECRPFRMIASMMNRRSRLSGIATGDQAMFMTRAAFDLVNGFDAIPLMEDIAMSKKLNTIAPPVCLESQVITAARRWEQKGVWRTVVLMWWLRLAYWMGIPPEKLARWYR